MTRATRSASLMTTNPHATGVRAEDHRSLARCAQRNSPNGGQVGPPEGEPCAGRGPAHAGDDKAKVGADDRTSGGLAEGTASTRSNDDRSGAADRAAAWRAVRAALEGDRSGCRRADGAGGGLRGRLRHTEDPGGPAIGPTGRGRGRSAPSVAATNQADGTRGPGFPTLPGQPSSPNHRVRTGV